MVITLLSGCVHALPPKPTVNERVKLAAIHFSNRSIDVKISEMLTTALKKDAYFILVDTNKIKRIFGEQNLQYSGLVDENTLVKLGHLLDADHVVLGELIDTQKVQSSSSIAIGLYSTTISVKIIDIKKNKMIGLISETGRSLTGGLGVTVKVQDKAWDELLGVQRTDDDMFNAALRGTTEKMANSIINAVYNKNARFIDADIKPSPAIETWTQMQPENRYSQAFAKLFSAPYEAVWAAVLKYFGNDIMVSDRQKGIIITKAFEPGGSLDKRQVSILIEQDKLNCTKLTLKGFCYSYNFNARASDCPNIWAPEEEWVKFKGTCYL